MYEVVEPAGSRDVLRLVRKALDEFDEVPLQSTVRRTVRIASLSGDSYNAVRLGLELKATGGHPPANAEATRRLMSDPSEWGVRGSVAEQALEEYMAERRNTDDLVVSHSLAEIEFWQAEFEPLEIADDQYASHLESRMKQVEIQTRARHHAFTLLCAWERQLTFSVTQETALDAVSRRVDALLDRKAPDVLSQFNVAFSRLREGAERDPNSTSDEELSQALTSCRRILKAIVDVVQPVDPARLSSDDGHELGDEQYKNRLFEFLNTNVSSTSFRKALAGGGETLFERFDAINGLSSKGVHASVALAEAEFCALHTYLLAGEILLIQQQATVEP